MQENTILSHVDVDSETSNASVPLVQVALALVEQVIRLLRETVTTDEQLSHQSRLIPGSTVGKHLRHIHDHYRLLLDAASSNAKPSSAPLAFSYDTRSRNVAAETSRQAALDTYVALEKRLRSSGADDMPAGRKMKLEAVTPVVVDLDTTWARELWFTSLHAIHHLSLLRVIVTGELGLQVPSDFGVAPSTLASREWSSNAASVQTDSKVKL